MSTIRVLIRDAPTLLRDILEHEISNQSDMELMSEPLAQDHAPLAGPPPPDVVVVNLTDSDPGEGVRALLFQWPTSHVLAITAHGHTVLQYELLPRGVVLGEMSPGQLVEAIRAAARMERQQS